MAQYALKASSYTTSAALAGQIASTYNIGLSDGTRYYGYALQNNGAGSTGFAESSDTLAKSALTNFSSGQLIDRDLAYFPRITDGDFSGGGYQEVWLDTTKYFDSDLDPRVPGYLQLRTLWVRDTRPGITAGTNYQAVGWFGQFWYTFGEANGNVYSATNPATVPVAASMVGLDTDGTYLYAGTGAALYRTANGTVWTAVSTTLNGTATRWWVANQGTAGIFAYYLSGSANLLYKIDLNAAFPVVAGAQPQVPVGANSFAVQDLVVYQNGIAILTNDATTGGFDVWFHDGVNMTRIVRMEGYNAQGICACLGNLYVGAYAIKQVSSPILALVSGGTFQVVARPGSPFLAASQSCLQPRASGQFVYWPILGQTIKGISAAPGVVIQYDTATGAVSHLPNQDTTDYTTTATTALRAIALLGDSVACVYMNGTTGTLQYHQPIFGSFNFQTTGWMVSSQIDFGTPGIAKRFRRIEVHHAPLNAGETITVKAFVDTDPLAFTTSLAAVPAGATVTNSTVGTSLTAMTFGADTIGKTLYFAMQLHAGTTGSTSPRVSYVSVELGGTWVWTFDLDCTSNRSTLQQQADPQNVTGKDLWFLIRNAYENGSNLTLYLAQGVSYTVAVESAQGRTVAYSDKSADRGGVKADEEWLGHVVLRQVA